MHFSKSTVLALVPFISAVVIARPSVHVAREDVGVPHDKVNGLLVDLDGDGKLDWVQVEGGRFTTIPNDLGLQYLNKGKGNSTVARDQGDTPSGWFGSHKWKSIGNVEGHSAKQSCIGSGAKIASSLIQSSATSACTAFLSQSAAGVVIDNGWNVFEKSGLADLAGKSININFRWGNLGGATNVKLTQQLCTELFNTLINGECGDKGDTQGGSIEVAEKLGFILGFDPNDA
ncbi:hypothetical protein F4779DRAFT_597142 [Xylariaceae sp. FL0662B]|nr:hypothetical protein F4779DRAFT_597142 [Xylariaceae sp. FL0662B]